MREKKAAGVEVELLSVGRKGHDYFRRRQVGIADTFLNVMNNVDIPLAESISEKATELFLGEEYQEVYILFNWFKTAATQIQTLRKLLPVAPEEEGGEWPNP